MIYHQFCWESIRIGQQEGNMNMISTLGVSRQKGFTLIELMFVIAIIGLLAAIAIPYFSTFQRKGFNSSAVNDLKNAYTAAQMFFSDEPSGTADIPTLKDYGLNISSGVDLSIVDGSYSGFSMTASHPKGDKTYSIDSEGSIN